RFHRVHEAYLDCFDVVGKIIVTSPQREHTMEVIRRNHPPIDVKRPLGPSTPDGLAQRFDMSHQQIGATLPTHRW
ncbi:MAG: hypothetical protein ACREBC_37070, partial [Pyrinomonadaceae bacterium]